jgi:DNA-binding response OmpR family regulator
VAKRILVVEDDAAVRVGLKLALEAKGFVVDAAADGQQALSMAAAEEPDVLICDWQLDDDELDGVDVARRLAEERGSAAAPDIIMVTARDLADLRNRAADLPVKVFLRKPVTLSAIFAALA